LKNIEDTIVAIATAPGHGAVSIIRVAGTRSWEIAEKICHIKPRHKQVIFCDFKDLKHEIIDQGLLLGFKAPHSLTGEDIVELQGHGGNIAPKILLDEILRYGARLAEPGEFSLRAYLNNKIDLTQAEAVADLVASESEQAARSSMRSLKGDFSILANHISEELMNLRTLIEAWLDFPDEDVPTEDVKKIQESFAYIESELKKIIDISWAGEKIKHNKKIAFVGAPNVGKSSLMNWLSAKNVSIISDRPGTTRDTIEREIILNGIALTAIDTAGIRESDDEIENEGIARSKNTIEHADVVILVCDAQDDADNKDLVKVSPGQQFFKVINKIDLVSPKQYADDLNNDSYFVSVKTEEGLSKLKEGILNCIAMRNNENTMTARSRHTKSSEAAMETLLLAKNLFYENNTLELVAEELRLTHQKFGEITGEVSSDDLLGEIFSSFCIGK
jgi:tRNA modification GTPase